ncbi:uncharacterized protein LOC6644703 [Drosophila willistoni]|uniref:uncharacterized protein LOC6644703 n=1 Tax=Drosophila willistoni TaxID=7260 RepID=UPI00017D7C21|nr:uncharacterized protein LOC6644703 [Drosophila willistoni]
MSKIPPIVPTKAKNYRLSETATATVAASATTIVEPVAPMPTLTSPMAYRTRRAVVESYKGSQSPSDDALLPMPPHNQALSPGAMIELVQTKLGIKNIVQKALGLLKRTV